jgi:predicted ArsR family transcriptional regulator
MEKQEMLMLSGKERDRLKVLHEVQGGHLTQGEAGGQLGISDREVRRLLGRMAEEGVRWWWARPGGADVHLFRMSAIPPVSQGNAG